MSWFVPDEDYEVEFEYSDGFFSPTKKGFMTVKASSEYEAKSSVKSLLGAQHSNVYIKSVRKCKKPDNTKERTQYIDDVPEYNPEDYSYKSSTVDIKISGSTDSKAGACDIFTDNLTEKQEKILRISIGVFLLLLISVFIAFEVFHGRVDGTYYLTSITGSAEVSADSNENYLTLKKGTCTLHFKLKNPAGESVVEYKYSGRKQNDIYFEKRNIHMDDEGRVVIRLDYENGLYNVFTYTKK